MTTPKRVPRVEDVGIPNYFEIAAATKALLLSLDSSGRFPGWKGPSPPFPEIIAEDKAEAYARLRMKLIEEITTPKFTSAQIANQILVIATAAEALSNALMVVRGETIDILNATETPWSDQFDRAPTLWECERAAAYLAQKARAANVPNSAKIRKGKSPSNLLPLIADQAAGDYFEITGMRPTRSNNKGQFPDFLGRLFAALQIEGHSSSYVQLAVETWRAGWV